MVAQSMIMSFRHKGLLKLFETGSASGVLAAHKTRLRMQLAALNTAMAIDDMNISGFMLHPLKGEMRAERVNTFATLYWISSVYFSLG